MCLSPPPAGTASTAAICLMIIRCLPPGNPVIQAILRQPLHRYSPDIRDRPGGNKLFREEHK